MVTRKISREKYIIAFVITALIFSSGLFLGLILTKERISQSEKTNNIQQQSYDSIQLQYLILKNLEKEDNCPAAIKTLESNIFELDNSRLKLESYIEKSLNENSQDFILLKRGYVLSEVRYWLLVKEAEKICKNNFVSILYFYSNKDCPDCGSQGMILTYIKDKFGEKVLIFALDSDFKENEPLIGVLEQTYNVTQTPALIIDGEKFQGMTQKEIILSKICPKYKEDIEVCKQYSQQ
ncbi:MAG TPA: hypothetical protein VJJ21_00405 [Candidatus Nanoarchaeia archaeon]|nr:hypothetical protein [Candidatus Nanoarchaeia archaeon]